ncbi:hypothetical protein SLEP1_g59048 [Rubroshorea leprosula]|uniref:Uncharacterized protein n=1 Tax=Rubroshorea leprosula TaxID=152421 RepID=A0AAV5MSE6_9ROSI|nr:hypothetical protein SLEP1_g59048 [Rubroshorea leprosula]
MASKGMEASDVLEEERGRRETRGDARRKRRLRAVSPASQDVITAFEGRLAKRGLATGDVHEQLDTLDFEEDGGGTVESLEGKLQGAFNSFIANMSRAVEELQGCFASTGGETSHTEPPVHAGAWKPWGGQRGTCSTPSLGLVRSPATWGRSATWGSPSPGRQRTWRRSHTTCGKGKGAMLPSLRSPARWENPSLRRPRTWHRTWVTHGNSKARMQQRLARGIEALDARRLDEGVKGFDGGECHGTRVRGPKSRASWHGTVATGTQEVCAASRGHAKQRRRVRARSQAPVEAQAGAWTRACWTRVSVSRYGVTITTLTYTRPE